jgi:hypothetical protein
MSVDPRVDDSHRPNATEEIMAIANIADSRPLLEQLEAGEFNAEKYTWKAIIDNRSRLPEMGTAFTYVVQHIEAVGICLVDGMDRFKKPTSSYFIVQWLGHGDPHVYEAASWHNKERYVLLHPLVPGPQIMTSRPGVFLQLSSLVGM